jgi:hypothetical protein
MTHQELNRLCEERINSLAPYIRTMPDEDMAQEARIGIFKALNKDPHANNTYLKQRAQWQMSSSRRRGRSVDNGFWKRDQITVFPYDHSNEEGVFSSIFKNRMRIPLDELVIDKIGMERLYAMLTELEKLLVKWKLDGWSDKKTETRLNISRRQFMKAREAIRFKIGLVFAD